MINADGVVLDREQYLEEYVRPAEIRWTSQEIKEPRLAGGGCAAVLTCLVHDVASYFGHPLNETFRSTLTWISTEHGWQCLAGHTSKLPAA